MKTEEIVLDHATYDNYLRADLAELGIPPVAAETKIAARWPVDVGGALHEARARGLRVTREDVQDFLLSDATIDADKFEAFLKFCKDHRRGEFVYASDRRVNRERMLELMLAIPFGCI